MVLLPLNKKEYLELTDIIELKYFILREYDDQSKLKGVEMV